MSLILKMPPATASQVKSLQILFDDCGFLNRLQRNRWLREEFKREINFLDSLTKYEANSAIIKLKGIKESQA